MIALLVMMATGLTAVRAQQAPQSQGGPQGGQMPRGPMMRDRMGRGMMGGGPMGAGALSPARFLNDAAVRERLGITADQAGKIRQQDAEFRKAQIRNEADLRVKRIELQELLAADRPERGAIDRKLQDVSNSQLALEKAAVNFRLNLRDLLTADQRQKLEQMRSELREQRGQQRPAPQGPGGMPGGMRGGRMGPGGQNPPPPPQGQPPNR